MSTAFQRPWMRRTLLSTVALSSLLLAACATQPAGSNAPQAGNAQVPAQFQYATAPTSAAVVLDEAWWKGFNDPALNALIDQALAHNTDLRVAAANLERVQALQAEVDDSSRPHVSVSGGPSYGHVSGLSVLKPGTVPTTRFSYSTGAALSYQVDATGQIRRAIEAAQANTEAAQAALDLVRVHVVANTARAYAGVCASGLRLQTAETSVTLQHEAVQLSERLQRAGRVGVIDTDRKSTRLNSSHQI